MATLVALWGGSMPRGDLQNVLAYLVPFSDRWDFRARARKGTMATASQDDSGGARWDVEREAIPAEHEATILAAARDLGLVNTRGPERNAVDYVLVLGGARLSNHLRTRRVAQLLKSGALRSRMVILLGAFREVSDAEREATDTYAPDAKTELDLFIDAAAAEFNTAPGVSSATLDEKQARTASAVHVLETRGFNTPVDLYAVAAPSGEPALRRANSEDTYRFFIESFSPSPKESCLLVTSQIYVPYQHLEATRTVALPHSLELETIGFPDAWGGTLQGMREPANYLQETRSAILAADRLHRSFLTHSKASA